MRTIIILLFLVIFFLFSIPYFIVEWLLGKINKPASDLRQLRVVQAAFKVILFLGGVKLEVIGEENVPTDRAVLYIGNHRSIFDIVVAYSRCPGLTGFISKISIKKIPVLSTWMKRLHCLFMDRNDMKQSMKVIIEAVNAIKNGVSICIFPEGTRNKEEDPTHLLPFKEGSFKIATKNDCPIVPMALIGTNRVFEDHFPWIRRTKVTLAYGEPIIPSSLDKEDQKRIGAYTQEIIQQLLNKYN